MEAREIIHDDLGNTSQALHTDEYRSMRLRDQFSFDFEGDA